MSQLNDLLKAARKTRGSDVGPHNPAASYDYGMDAAQQLLDDGFVEGGGEPFTLDHPTADRGYVAYMEEHA